MVEELELEYQSDGDLSYIDSGGEYIKLLHKEKYVNDVYVWRDSEMDGREYIIINYTVVYLDTIKKV
jgi:hypothetical protein